MLTWTRILAGLAAALLTYGAASPAAFAYRLPPDGGSGAPARTPAQIHTIVAGGMPGWQITLIATTAAAPWPPPWQWSSTGPEQPGGS